ncbi:MAG: CHASE2 domain-containing serine/threonine-protein kinase [Leptolyngbyaceae bacterium]|nr:CHASE2 domain-containing serine/threonine-protein kinase [Leptolyngbyaceae bacterium]
MRQKLTNLPPVLKSVGLPVGLVSVLATGFVWVGYQLGVMQPLELAAFDQMVRLQQDQGADPRLLIVQITEADIKAQKRWPLSDQVIAQLLQKLQQQQPRVIGLDIYRDVPQATGRAELLTQLKAPNVVVIKTLGGADTGGVPAPPGVSEEQIGFNDVITDPDGVIRRNLIFGNTETHYVRSFALQLAIQYLKNQVTPPISYWQQYTPAPWGKALFTPLESDFGAYQGIDAKGYQILLQYRSPKSGARQVTLSEILQGQVDPSWIKDKIVLIGTTAPSAKDLFFTPYSGAERKHPKMPGIWVHAQMVSQILDAIQGDRPLFWSWPGWGEFLWLGSWSLLGSLLAWRLRHPLFLGLAGSMGCASLWGISLGLFSQAGWIPVVTTGVAFLGSGASVVAYIAYQLQQEQKSIALQAQDQTKTIALLRTLLDQQTSLPVSRGLTDSTSLPTEVSPPPVSRVLTDSTSLPTEVSPPPISRVLTESTRLPTELETPEIGNFPMHLSTNASEIETSLPVITTTQSTGSDRPSLSSPRISSSLLSGRYQIIKILGSGGFSMTYLAEDTQRPSNPLCVVKHLLPARTDNLFLQTARRLFKTEAEILEKLGSHDRIPQLLASFEANSEFYLVQELVEGHPLSDELLKGKQFPDLQVAVMLKDVLEVLTFVHQYQVIHRDIKPSNLMRRKQDQRLVVIDFGAVKQMHPQAPAEEAGRTVAIGTRGYAAPEQLAGHPTLSSDIYALGTIAIEALTGIPPYELEQDPRTGTLVWRHLAVVNEGLANIIDGMVHYYFNERYQSAAEVLQVLKRWIDAHQSMSVQK